MEFYKQDLWPKIENLFLNDYCANFWSVANIRFPYGHIMVIDPRDMPSMLWQGNLNHIDDHSELISKSKTLSKTYNCPIGFSISSSWVGDITSFKKKLTENHYECSDTIAWLVKDISDFNTKNDSKCIIQKPKDLHEFSKVLKNGFDTELADFFSEKKHSDTNDTNRIYLVAIDNNTGTAIGCVSAYYKTNSHMGDF